MMSVEMPNIHAAPNSGVQRPRPFPCSEDILTFVRKLFAVFFVHVSGAIVIMFLVRFQVMPLLRQRKKVYAYHKECQIPEWIGGEWPYYVCWFSSLTMLIVVFVGLHLAKERHRSFPMNVFCLSVFTVVLGVVLGMLDSKVVHLAAETMLLVAIFIMLISFQKKTDITSYLIYVMLVCFVLLGTSIECLCSYVMLQGTCAHVCYYVNYKEWHQMVISGLLSYMFGHYIIYKTQDMVMNRHHFDIMPEEYVFACLTFYTDIFDRLVSLAMFSAYLGKILLTLFTLGKKNWMS